MGKEITARNIKPVSTNDCLTGTVCTVAGYFAPGYYLHPDRTTTALHSNTDHYLTNLFDLLAQNDLGVIHHDLLRLENDPEKLFEVITLALEEGCLCELSVKGKPWVRDILGITTGLPRRETDHSILIYGYYQPDEYNLWLYTLDSYITDHVFLDWWDLLRVVSLNRNRIHLNLFGLFETSHSTLKKHSVKDRYESGKIKRNILSLLSGATTGEKLRFLFHKKSHHPDY